MTTTDPEGGPFATEPVLSRDVSSTDRLTAGTARSVSNALATMDERAMFRLAATAASLALAALMVGGGAMALTSRPGAGMATILASIADHPVPFVAAGVGLALVSLFDLFTIPALHLCLGRYGRVLVTLATGTAIVGDLLGILGRLAQTAVVPLVLQTTAHAGTGIEVLGVLDTTFNTAGFLLVSVSFTCFGLLMMRGFSRPLGCIAMTAGLFTLLGQVPILVPLFMVANLAYIAWYVGLARRFRSGASGAPPFPE
jgi:hypothetical protein